jgi:hypothetical protein
LLQLVLPIPRGPDYAAIPLVGGFALGTVLAWIYWSLTIPRWRIWSLQRVRDWDRLIDLATDVLVWPPGHFFEKTEIWSRNQRRIAQELLLARRREQRRAHFEAN